MSGKASGTAMKPVVRADIPALRWWHGLIVGILLAYTPGSLLIGGVLLLPLLFLRLLDREADGQRMTVVMFYLGAVMIHPLHVAWVVQGNWAQCVQEIEQPRTLLLDWAALGMAWLLAEGGSVGARLWYVGQERQRRRQIEARIKALQEEWINADPPEA